MCILKSIKNKCTTNIDTLYAIGLLYANVLTLHTIWSICYQN